MKKTLSNKQQAIVCMIAELLSYLFSLYESPILVKHFHHSSITNFIAISIAELMGAIIYYIFKIIINLNKK